MIQPCQWQKKWLLASGVQTVSDIGVSGSPAKGAARTHTTFAVCWSSRGRWVPQAVLGQLFKSGEEATAYLDENREKLESAPGLVG